MTTLLVVDEYDEGFPVVFFLTSSVDAATLCVCFGAIKDFVGVIQAQYFMTDDAPAFYNAWCLVMGRPGQQLLCSWHVDKSWQKRLLKVTHMSAEKRAFIYKLQKVCHCE